jgi:DNA-directed RNA polymerase subunit M/transcription elongation factor TFIIS
MKETVDMSISIQNTASFRTNIADSLYAHIFRDKTDDPHAQQLARSIEKGIYDFAVNECKSLQVSPVWENASFVTVYTCRFRTLYLNLKNKPAFLDQIIKEIIPETQFAHLRHVDISSDTWMPYIQRLMEREKYAQEKVQETSDLFTCPKCETSHTTHYSLQTRGGDEPMTIFINCIECDHKWTE